MKSIRTKLFVSFTVVVILIVMSLLILNNVILETYYIYIKTDVLKGLYNKINNYYNEETSDQTSKTEIESELEKISIRNNFDILIRNNENLNIYTSNKDFFIEIMSQINTKNKYAKDFTELFQNDKITIIKQNDMNNEIKYIILEAQLDNGYYLYVRMPIASIKDSVKISNTFLYMIAGVVIIIGGIIVLIISKYFTEPIVELNDIAKKMSNLDFSQKYKDKGTHDELINLGNSINILSEKLEATIKQLKENNNELEKDIEAKSKLEEMRTSFISDVSHELKTPISLIQGYSEGLLENVNTDEESRKFYAEVILDESNKMDKLVKQLLELMKLEYGKREFNDKEFNIVELEKEIIRKSTVKINEKNIKVEFDESKCINVIADDFYIDQVFTNYLTNAIKNIQPINDEQIIKISNIIIPESKSVKISVYNTGKEISEEDLTRIWNRFYKVDESRNRNDGGSGIGLSIVKAIMNNYGYNYGVKNKYDGVEFYFELPIADEKEDRGN